MMSEPTVVDARLDKIEQDNRRLKLAVGALLLVLAAVPLIGAVMPEQIPGMALGSFLLLVAAVPLVGAVISDGTPGAIEALEFRVVDENGTLRALMMETGFLYLDENGNIRASISNSGIGYFDENGNMRAMMVANGFLYSDENDNVWAMPMPPFTASST